MWKVLGLLGAAWLVLAVMSGCVIPFDHGKVDAAPQIHDGYGCFRQQINPIGALSSNYYCVFALEQASTYYHESDRTQKATSFISQLSRDCKVGNSKFLEEPRATTIQGEVVTTADHVLSVVVVEIHCN